MSRFILIGRYLRSAAGVLSAAQAVSAAVESQRQPSADALRTLGIDPEQFSHHPLHLSGWLRRNATDPSLEHGCTD